MPNPSKILYSSPLSGIVLGWFLALEAVVISIDPHAIQGIAFAALWLYIEIQRYRDRRAKGETNPTAGLVEDLKGLGDLLRSAAIVKGQLDQAVAKQAPPTPEAKPDGTAPKADRA